ncbi:hypothetical protein FPOAC1_000200 [Fusarium poae]|uniref:hypothetical protein n=1 Tax=Fusarium poae TaxID=36050 RepID=UPI001CE7F308|nr:hypothetical protein FPOAC1_000200 [Fusarium poae]KAG8674236.1 hypothetical protein FPOAC1_000200 [Fusarium poae]
MAQALRSETGGEPDIIDTTGPCLLSLDGGGVRGISTLYVLQNLMRRVNIDRNARGLGYARPCDVFDLIGGTSTGGLIAIMLGRLEMDVHECIDAYSGLMQEVFQKKRHRLQVTSTGQTQPRFDSRKLQAAIEKVIKSKNEHAGAMMNDKKERGCHVFVCAALKNPYSITRLRTYEAVDGPSNIEATIVQAALATSAATGFFDGVCIDGSDFVDAALGKNNPVDLVEREAMDIWSRDEGDLMNKVKCFISIGTGKPDYNAVEDWMPKFLTETLVKIVTNTESAAATSIARWRGPYDRRRYFRFNVDKGLEHIGIEEYKKKTNIKRATELYLDDQVQRTSVRHCAENLGQKQNKTNLSFEQCMKNQSQWSEKDLDCLQWLLVVNPEGHVQKLEGEKGGLLQDLHEWILRKQEFVAFMNWSDTGLSPQPCRVLWIKGHAGTGKTMLLMGLLREIEVQFTLKEHSICYFFCQASDSRLNHVTSVLRSLIWLLVQQQPQLARHLRKMYEDGGPALFDDSGIAFYILRKTFENMLKEHCLRPVYFIVDALDECRIGQPGVRDLIDLMMQSMSISEKVRWLVSSRPEIGHLAHENYLSIIELSATNLGEPVRAYIEHKINMFRTREGYSDHVRAALSQEVHKRARNIFLWVALVFADLELNETHGAFAVDRIKKSPPELDRLYEHMMDRMESRARVDTAVCKEALVAVMLAYRPLSFKELSVLANLPSNIEVRTIIRECGSFLTITEEDRVQLIHQSAMEYLEKSYIPKLGDGGKARSHFHICQRSVVAMSILGHDHKGLGRFDSLPEEQLISIRERLNLLEYYCCFWAFHFCESRSSGSEMRIWSTETWSIRHALDKHNSAIKSIAFSPDSKSLVSTSSDGNMYVWDAEEGIFRQPLERQSGSVSSSVFSPDGNKLATASRDGNLLLWDTSTYGTFDNLTINKRPKKHVTDVAFSPDGTKLASSSHDKIEPNVRLWDLKEMSHLKLEGHSKFATSVAFSQNGKLLAAGAENGVILIWDAQTGEKKRQLDGDGKSFTSVAFSPTRDILAAACEDKTVWLWNEDYSSRVRLRGHHGPVADIAFSSDGTMLASASFDRTVRVWDMDFDVSRYTTERKRCPVTAVALSADCSVLAYATEDGTIQVSDTSSDSHQKQMLSAHTKAVYALKFSKDGNKLVSASKDGTVRYWDLRSSGNKNMLAGKDEAATVACFSLDGSILAAATKSHIYIWDVGSGRLKDKILTNKECTTLFVSEDGQRIKSDHGSHTSKALSIIRRRQNNQNVHDSKLSISKDWILYEKRRLLWLPTDYRPTCAATSDNVVVMGHRSGSLSILKFDLDYLSV